MMIDMIEVEIPQGTQVEIKGTEIHTKGALGSNTRGFNDALLIVAKDGNKIKIDHTKEKKQVKMATVAEISLSKQLQNDINGVTKHYEINMQVVFAHFPATVEAKPDTVLIKNLIGERAPRVAKIAGTTKIEVKGQNVRLYGTSKDDVAQTAANIRKACKIVKKDERTFQDGVYYAIE
jgi:large subunit ribosomal protein L6